MKKAFITFFDFFFLLRIPLLVPVWTVMTLGWITGSDLASPGGGYFINLSNRYSENIFWIALAGFSLIVASIYVLNQINDIESDRINRKLFILPNGLISIKAAWGCTILCAFLGFGIAFFYLDMVMVIIFIISLILGILYNMPPFNLKNHAWGGVFANFLGHGLLTFLVGWYAANFKNGFDLSLIQQGLIPSLTAGFANAAVFLATTIPDKAGDKPMGKRTFCVVYGEKWTAIAAAVSCGFALLFSFTLQYNAWVMVIPSGISLVIFIIFAITTKHEFAFQAFRWPVYILSTFVVIFIPLYGVIILVTLIISRIYYKRRFNIEYPTLKSK